MNLQEIIINLKVIESLEANQKLITKETILNIEPLSIIPEFARRWLRQDNREETIKKINYIIDKAIEIIELETNNKQIENSSILEMETESSSSSSNEELTKTKPNNLIQSVYYDCGEITNKKKVRFNTKYKSSINLLDYLYKSRKGLHNLKKTYFSCIKTCAKIDFIIDKIDNTYNFYNDTCV